MRTGIRQSFLYPQSSPCGELENPASRNRVNIGVCRTGMSFTSVSVKRSRGSRLDSGRLFKGAKKPVAGRR
nr:hypothetical protein [Escherichia coli]